MKIYLMLILGFGLLKGASHMGVADFRDVYDSSQMEELSKQIVGSNTSYTAKVVKDIGKTQALNNQQTCERYVFLSALGVYVFLHTFDAFVSESEKHFDEKGKVYSAIFFENVYHNLRGIILESASDMLDCAAGGCYVNKMTSLLKGIMKGDADPFSSLYLYFSSSLIDVRKPNFIYAIERTKDLLQRGKEHISCKDCVVYGALRGGIDTSQKQEKPSPYFDIAPLLGCHDAVHVDTFLDVKFGPDANIVGYRERFVQDDRTYELFCGARLSVCDDVQETSEEKGLIGCRIWENLDIDFVSITGAVKAFYTKMRRKQGLTPTEEAFGIVWAYGVQDHHANYGVVRYDEFTKAFYHFFMKRRQLKLLVNNLDMKKVLYKAGILDNFSSPYGCGASSYIKQHAGDIIKGIVDKVHG